MVAAPEPVQAPAVTLDQGEVAILPASRQLVAGRPSIGVSVRVADVDPVGRHPSAAGITARVEPNASRRVVVAPSETHRVWLEFR